VRITGNANATLLGLRNVGCGVWVAPLAFPTS